MSQKELYLELFNKHKAQIPLFYWPKWLDAVTDGKWDMHLYVENDEIIALMPICEKKKFGLNAVYTPLLSPYQGIYFLKDFDLKEAKKNSKKYRIIKELLSQIPSTHYYLTAFHPNFDHAFPILEKGYSSRLMYTYILDNIKKHDVLFENMKPSLRNKIRKAEKRLVTDETHDIDLLHQNVKKTFHRQEMEFQIDLDLFEKIKNSIPNNSRILTVKDQDSKIHAAHLLVWDHTTAYNILLGGDSQLRSSGAVPLLLWHSIKTASEKVDRYDFEGSMLPNVKSFFESFGGSATPYYMFQKASNPILKSALFLFNKFK